MATQASQTSQTNQALADMQTKIDSLTTRVTTLETTVTTTQSNIATLQTQMSTAQSDITTLFANDLSIGNSITAINTTNSQQDTQITNLRLDLTTVQGRVTTAESNIATLFTTTASLQTQVNNTFNTVSSHSTSIDNINASISSIISTNVTQDNRLSSHDSTLTSHSSSISGLQSQMATANSNISSNTSNINSLSSELATYKSCMQTCVGCNCFSFSPTTLFQLSNGHKVYAKDIHQGDRILSSGLTMLGLKKTSLVLSVGTTASEEPLVDISLKNRSIQITASHPIITTGSSKRWRIMKAIDLLQGKGHQLLTAHKFGLLVQLRAEQIVQVRLLPPQQVVSIQATTEPIIANGIVILGQARN